MALYIEGLFLGVSKRSDMKGKDGKIYADRPMYQLLATEPVGHIGYRSTITNVTIGTYGNYPDDAEVSELYQRYKDKYMKECKLSVSQYTKDNVNYYSTESQPVFLEKDSKDSKEKPEKVISPLNSIGTGTIGTGSGNLSPGQRLAAATAS